MEIKKDFQQQEKYNFIKENSSEDFSIELKRISTLLDKVIKIYEEDRNLALENYKKLKKQYDLLIEETYMSEEANLEKQLNHALKLVFESGKRLDETIQVLSKILISNLNNISREKIALSLSRENLLNTPVDIQKLLKDNSNT